MQRHVQIAVVGGGLSGKAAAHAAARPGFDTLHIAPEAPADRRTSALMMPSVDYMQRAGLIASQAPFGVPLSEIRIIDATSRLVRAPETLFCASEFGQDQFGFNFANTMLAQAFDTAIAGLQTFEHAPVVLQSATRREDSWELTLSDGVKLSADLLIGADGKKSAVRGFAGISTKEHAFSQSALVCDLRLERPLGGCSVEFHYENGPFTLVPAGDNRANLVWIDKADALEPAKSDPAILGAALAEKSMHLFGAIETASPAVIFPLSTLRVETAGKDGAVLVGDAAHAFPPIGAQGLNLGLRDVEALSKCLSAANPSAFGWAGIVTRGYAQARQTDLAQTGTFVDSLFRSLLSEWLPAQTLRSTGLWALKTIPALRRGAIRFGMGTGTR